LSGIGNTFGIAMVDSDDPIMAFSPQFPGATVGFSENQS
jgi:hypothetical protein